MFVAEIVEERGLWWVSDVVAAVEVVVEVEVAAEADAEEVAAVVRQEAGAVVPGAAAGTVAAQA